MKNDQSTIALIIDSLKSGIRTNNLIKDQWIKYLEKLDKGRSVLDIIFILILLDTIGMKKKAEQSFSKLLSLDSDGVIEMLQVFFSTCGKNCIQGFYNSILSLADFTLRTCPDHHQVPVMLYYELFKSISDRFYQQVNKTVTPNFFINC